MNCDSAFRVGQPLLRHSVFTPPLLRSRYSHNLIRSCSGLRWWVVEGENALIWIQARVVLTWITENLIEVTMLHQSYI